MATRRSNALEKPAAANAAPLRPKSSDHRKSRAVGCLSITLIQVEVHPYRPETELLEFRKQNHIVYLAFAPSGTDYAGAIDSGESQRCLRRELY